jgi:hydroxymethylpyrimidine pyrophosphatase-like HAD family hydrolase
MRYLALVADYDGTLARHDRVSDDTAHALERLRTSGRRAIVVTGRRLDDLLAVFSQARLCDLIVAENGAIVYDPATREERVLANPPSKALVQRLRAREVQPLEIGQVIVATLQPHRSTVQDVIWELGLELQIICNGAAVMVLPAGVCGRRSALAQLLFSRHRRAAQFESPEPRRVLAARARHR